MKRVEVRRIYQNVVRTASTLQVKLPRLEKGDGKFTVGGLTLVYFASRMGEIGRKADLIRFLREMRCNSTDPQPRHLGMQHGLNFLVKGCYHQGAGRVLRSGEYSLLDLSSTHPSAGMMHRSSAVNGTWFDRLKRQYDCRCACCGSKESERHFKNSHVVTTLDKGHCDPRKPLNNSNCIPMCTLCNMVYKDHAVFNRRGFIVGWLSAADPQPSTPQKKRRRAVGIAVPRPRRRIFVGIQSAVTPTHTSGAPPYSGPITRSRAQRSYASS